MKTYGIEVTDTFGGEPNYSWARRYELKAKSYLGAIQKVSRIEGLNFRLTYSIDLNRYDAKNACTCVFIN